ncbi:DUF881 domain-containing protein [Blastococcus sp. SYSU DS0828]
MDGDERSDAPPGADPTPAPPTPAADEARAEDGAGAEDEVGAERRTGPEDRAGTEARHRVKDGAGAGDSPAPEGHPDDAAPPAPDDATPPTGDAGARSGSTSTSTGDSPPTRSWSRPVAVATTAALAVALGFALTVQIRSTAEPGDQDVRREADLVVILDELGAREATLRQQIAETRQTLEDLGSGQEESGSALAEARSRAEAIGILAGTLPARGPGVRLTIQDPGGAVPTSVILGAIQELRGAGAEVLQVDDVRVVASSAVTGSPGALRIDGQPLTAPYDFLAIGPPAAMDVALSVSGGVIADVARAGGKARVDQEDLVSVDATVD